MLYSKYKEIFVESGFVNVMSSDAGDFLVFRSDTGKTLKSIHLEERHDVTYISAKIYTTSTTFPCDLVFYDNGDPQVETYRNKFIDFILS